MPSRSISGAATFCSGRRCRKGHFEAAKAGGGPDYGEASSWVAKPGAEATRRIGCPTESRPAAAARRRSSTSTRPPISSAIAGTRRSHADGADRVPDPAVRPEPGERVQRRRRNLGAALSPGGLRRVPAEERGCARRRSTSPIAMSPPAFDAFVAEAGDRPIILAGHSQGALHLSGCLREQVAGKPIATPHRRRLCRRLAGQHHRRPARARASRLHLGRAGRLHPARWHELRRARQPGPASSTHGRNAGLDRRRPRAARTCCASTRSAERRTARRAPAANPGHTRPERRPALGDAGSRPGRRALRQGPADRRRRRSRALGPYVLPGNNYHVYDYALFWGAIRRDAERRLAAWRR